jgi:hypothetical protein
MPGFPTIKSRNTLIRATRNVMKTSFYRGGILLLATLLVAFLPEAAQASTTTAPKPYLKPDITTRLDTDPRGFIPNLGQCSNDSVRFTARDGRVTAHFTESGFVLQNGETATVVSDGVPWTVPVAPRWEVVGARPVRPVGGKTYDHTVSYFRGNDRAKWRANVPAYRTLSYPEILPGTEMRFESHEHGFEYTFHVQPHAKPDLRFRYQCVTALEKTHAGDLVIRAAKGHFTESRPVAFQVIDGIKHAVESSFEIVSTNEYRIALGTYDRSHELIIDPVLDWSTFWGGSQSDNSKILKVNQDGHIIVAGNSFSTDLPETSSGFGTGPGVNSSGGSSYRDAYVAKFSADGTQLLWSGYLGGDGATDDEMGWKGLAVDATGDVYVSGYTMSSDFPVTTATPHAGALDVFVTKIQSNGSQILWSRLLGGTAEDWSSGIALDATGNLFISGYTRSGDFPITPGTFDQALGGAQDVFVTKLAAASGAVQWSSYLGGSADERVVGIVATSDGGAIAFGDTDSSDFPVVSAFDSTFGGMNDAFVTKIAGDGTSLVWSTFLGGSDKEHDQLMSASDPFAASWAKGDIALDSAGNVLVVGQTYSADFPATPGALQTTRRGDNDGYVAKFTPAGNRIWASYLGGNGPADPDGREEIAWGVAVNPWDEIFVVGWTQSTDFPTTVGSLKPTQPNAIRYDGFLTQLSADGSQLLYSTYIGGYENNDVVLGVTYDKGNVFLTGWAAAATFPATAGAFQTGCVSCETPNLWAADGYVLKFLDAFIAHDGFESGNFSGGSGWFGSWTAQGDNSILTSATPHSGTRHARLRGGTGYLQRTINVPVGVTTLSLGFWAKVNSFESADQAYVFARKDNAAFGPALITFTSAQSDSTYHYYERDLSHLLPATQIQIAFDAAMSSTSNDNWYLDDIRITGTSQPPPPPADPLHVDGLVGSSAASGRKNWTATVSVTMHDGNHAAVPGATVSVQWTGGATASAVTDATGRCTFTRTLSNSITSTTLAVTGATHSALSYSAAANHSTSIVVNKQP